MPSLHRILDANFNRAREGLRVLEDLARFGLDHAGWSEELKSIRHALTAAMDSLPTDRGSRLAHRDTPGDVGVAISTASEFSRADLRAVASAAAGRTSEALRAIEECAKAVGSPAGTAPGAGVGWRAARDIEALRYRLYEVEKRVVLALPGDCPQWRVCVLLTESLCTHHPWLRVAQLAIDGGADCLQLREKTLDSGEWLARARALVDLAKPRGVSVVINDRPDIAVLSGADGVHLGQQDLPVIEARKLAGFGLWVGVSTANIQQARQSAHDGADYCGVGPMFASTTKHKPVLSGSEYLKSYLADPVTAARPHLAISGITPENIGELAAVGCRGVAVSSVVCGAEDPAGVCRGVREAMGAGEKVKSEKHQNSK